MATKDKSETLFLEAERLLALPPEGRDTLRRLTVLRARLAKDAGMPAFRILTNRQMLGLAELPPQTQVELGARPGIGPLLARAYGAEIIAAVRARGSDGAIVSG